MPPPPASLRGFTLLEMLLAISIVAILLGLSAPAMQRLYSSAQYRQAVGDVMALLTSARYKAIRSGGSQDVLVNPVTREIALGDSVRTLPDSLRLEVLGSRELNREGAGIIRFYPDGGSSGGAVSLFHTSGSATRVEVDWLLGRVSHCREPCTLP